MGLVIVQDIFGNALIWKHIIFNDKVQTSANFLEINDFSLKYYQSCENVIQSPPPHLQVTTPAQFKKPFNNPYSLNLWENTVER